MRRLVLASDDTRAYHDLEHGILTSGGGGAIEAVIVALTLVFSLTVLRCAWDRFDSEGRPAAP